MKIFLLLASVFLTACAAQVVSSSPRTVVIKTMGPDYNGAQKLADIECGKHKLFAQLAPRGAPSSNFIFNCVN
jgi:hypothetical protein